MIERDGRGPKINANVVVGLLRRAYESGGEPKLRNVARSVIASGLTDEQILSIATNKADLRGETPGPIEYFERRSADVRIEPDSLTKHKFPRAKRGPPPFNREPRKRPKARY